MSRRRLARHRAPRAGEASTTRSGLFAAAAIVLVAGAAFSHQPPQPPAAQPTFRTEANFVRVDAYPTRNGAPVTDLTAQDFELLEDNTPQKVETFEHVAIRSAGPQAARIEPNTVRDANTMAAEARARVFVIFLDTYHVSVDASHNIRAPLIRLLDRVIGPDDLVAVMTPEMSAHDITFARKTTTIEGMLTRYWSWGRRESRAGKDPQEEDYEMCFPVPYPAKGCENIYFGVAEEMILRRREKRALDALIDLAVHLRGVREERKAVIAVSNGWTRYRPNDKLARKVPEACVGNRIPGAPGIFVGPEGRLSTRDPRNPQGAADSQCERDRVLLSQLDNDRDFRDLLDVANRSNVSFYPIDPRGLAVFDSSIDTGISIGMPPPPPIDRANLKSRLDSLHVLAENTDGLAVVDSNNLDAGLTRISADLSSYYLLGYYSSNSKLDGSYRRITVRVKRPGVDVRARRGYRAATADEVTAARAAAAAPAAVDSAIPDALSAIAAIKREARLRVHVAPSGDGKVVWVVGELDPSYARDDWRNGGEAAITVSKSPGGEAIAASAPIEAKRRSFLARLDASALAPGAYSVRVRVSAADATPAMDVVSFTIEERPRALGTPILFRRGPFTTLPFEPAADRRFRRNETLRVQAAAPQGGATVRLLDRTGRAINVPIAAKEIDADGVHWIVGDLPLAPLAAGEYLVEVASPTEKVVTAFAVTL